MGKNILQVVIAASLAIGSSCWAQSSLQTAVGASAKRTVLKTFQDAEGQQKGTPIDVTSVIFPIPIYETSSAGYVRTKVAGRDIWLDPDQLVLDARIDAKCLVTKGQPLPFAGGLRGANEACK